MLVCVSLAWRLCVLVCDGVCVCDRLTDSSIRWFPRLMLLQMAYCKSTLEYENNSFGVIWDTPDEGILCLFALFTVCDYDPVPACNFPRIIKMPVSYTSNKRKVTDNDKPDVHHRSFAKRTRSKSSV